MRARKFRAIEVTLECGCTVKLSTSFYRLTKARAAAIVGDAVRKAQMCPKHGLGQQIVKSGGVVSLED